MSTLPEAEPLPRGKDVTVPVAAVGEIELCFDQPLPDDVPRAFMSEQATEIINFIAPDLLEAVADVSPSAEVRTGFADSFEEYLREQCKRSRELNCSTMLQKKAILCEIPNKGRREFSCVLSVYVKRGAFLYDQVPGDKPLMYLIAPNHRLVPDRKPTEVRLIIDLPKSFAAICEPDVRKIVAYLVDRAARDTRDQKKKSLRGLHPKEISRRQVVLTWREWGEVTALKKTLRELQRFWDTACREVLCDLIASNPTSAQLRADIDKLDSFTLREEGEAFYDKAEYTKAEELYRKAIALYAQHSVVHNNLACALSKLGRHDEAVASMKQTRRIDPVDAQATKNLPGIIGAAMTRVGRVVTAHCPLAECDARISIRLPWWGGSATGKCEVCHGAQVTVTPKSIKETVLFQYSVMGMGGFPAKLPAGLLKYVEAEPNGVWPLEAGNVLFKVSSPDLIRKNEALCDLELYFVRQDLVPIIRFVLIIQDHPKNPSIVGCCPNVTSPRDVWNLRYLKTVDKIKLHVYDARNSFMFTREVPVSQADVPNSGAPEGAPLRRITLPRPTWAEYVDGVIDAAKSMCARLPQSMRDHRLAFKEFNSHPTTCICEVCDRQSLTTRSQFKGQSNPSGTAVDASKLKLRDAIKCGGCNVVVCMECAAKRIATDGQGRVLSPLTCAVCGQAFISGSHPKKLVT